MNITKGLMAILVTMAMLSAMVGCAGPDTIVKRQAPLPEGKGMVVLHVASALEERENWSRIEVWSEREKKVYNLYREKSSEAGVDEYPSTAHFSGALPPGTYWVDALKHTYRNTNYGLRVVSSSTAPAKEQLGKFRVETGRLTDLGTVVYYPEHWNLKAGQFRLFRIPSAKDTISAIQHKNPVAYAAMSRNPALGWSAARNVLPKKAIDALQANMPRMNPLVETETGEILAGGMLGRIFKRNKSGKWSQIETGTAQEIFQIVVSGRKTLYATGEHILLKSEDGGRRWRELALPSVVGRVEFFHIGAGGIQYLYLLSDGGMLNRYTLYTRAKESQEWRVAAENTFDNGFVDRPLPSDYRVRGKDGLTFFVRSSHYRFHPDEQSVSRDIVAGVLTAKYFADGSLYGMETEFNIGGKPGAYLTYYDPQREEKDQRYHWEDATLYDMFFLNKEEGYVVKRTGSKTELIRTKSGGRSWETVTSLRGARPAVHVTRRGVVLLIYPNGTVYASSDGGKKWVREREPVNLLALAIKNKK